VFILFWRAIKFGAQIKFGADLVNFKLSKWKKELRKLLLLKSN